MMLKGKGKVLVVDDNEDVRLSMKLLLERAGYEVVIAPDGNRALELQRELPCHVLVTDIFMPEADGMETIERFRREFPAVKIVAMSAGGKQIKGRTYLDTAGAVGADATFQKPFEPATLLENAARSTLRRIWQNRFVGGCALARPCRRDRQGARSPYGDQLRLCLWWR
jgi:CheY-like chemotaxis protein